MTFYKHFTVFFSLPLRYYRPSPVNIENEAIYFLFTMTIRFFKATKHLILCDDGEEKNHHHQLSCRSHQVDS